MPAERLWGWLASREDRVRKWAETIAAVRCLELGQLSANEVARFEGLWDRRSDGLSEPEGEELYALLTKCQIVDSEKICEDADEEDVDVDNDEDVAIDTENNESQEEYDDSAADEDEDDADTITPWHPVELAFIIAFHRYAKLHDSIVLPIFDNLLNVYLIATGCRLFEKYGWDTGEPDCSTIRPLHEWGPGDRSWIITLYQWQEF